MEEKNLIEQLNGLKNEVRRTIFELQEKLRKMKNEKDALNNWLEELKRRNQVLAQANDKLLRELETVRRTTLELENKIRSLERIKKRAEKMGLLKFLINPEVRIISFESNQHWAKVILAGRKSISLTIQN
jgi:uncharacterized coiled-coil DUF342 family protein